jgi:hypothetical protein
MSPTTTEPPVQVTLVPPRTENCDAAPSDTWAHAGETPASSAAIPSTHVDMNFLLGLAELANWVMLLPFDFSRKTSVNDRRLAGTNPLRVNAPFANLKQPHTVHVVTIGRNTRATSRAFKRRVALRSGGLPHGSPRRSQPAMRRGSAACSTHGPHVRECRARRSGDDPNQSAILRESRTRAP